MPFLLDAIIARPQFISAHHCRSALGRRTGLHLQVRRFLCRHPDCPRRTFSEPLPEVVAPSARRSLRLANEQRQLGLQVGGAVAARVAQRQGMPVSSATILRLVRRTRLPEVETPRCLVWMNGRIASA